MAGDAVTSLQLTAHPTRQENVSDKTAVLSMGSNKWVALCVKSMRKGSEDRLWPSRANWLTPAGPVLTRTSGDPHKGGYYRMQAGPGEFNAPMLEGDPCY
jgi:hypothetical protein